MYVDISDLTGGKRSADPVVINIAHLELRQSNISSAGLGVFTRKNIVKDETVEIAPLLLIKDDCLFQVKKNNILDDYVFTSPETNAKYYGLALGYGSMYNHSDEPNIDYIFDHENKKMIYKAIKDIEKGSELYISYGNKWWKSRKLSPT
jgi:SET domain-containing protein